MQGRFGKGKRGAGDMAQPVKALATKTEDQNSIPETHKMEKEHLLTLEKCLLISTQMLCHTYTYRRIQQPHTSNKCILFHSKEILCESDRGYQAVEAGDKCRKVNLMGFKRLPKALGFFQTIKKHTDFWNRRVTLL